MTEKRKQEIINRLLNIASAFKPTDEELNLTMFSLISRYNEQYDNPELIGGKWVRENVPELKDLP